MYFVPCPGTPAPSPPSTAIFATWDPANKDAQITLSNGNLTASQSVVEEASVRATVFKIVQKWYWEVTSSTIRSNTGVTNVNGCPILGIPDSVGQTNNSLGYRYDGIIIKGAGLVAAVAAYTIGDVIGIAYNADDVEIEFYKNNVLQYVASGANVPPLALTAAYSGAGAGQVCTATANFGATALVYTPPTGFAPGLYLS